MKIDTEKLKDQYATLQLADGSSIQVTLADEGIGITRIVNLKVKETTWKSYQKMIDGDEVEEVDPDDITYALTGQHGTLPPVNLVKLTKKEMIELNNKLIYSGYTNVEVITMKEWKVREERIERIESDK